MASTEDEAKFRLTMEDNASDAASSVAAELRKLQEQINRDKKLLGELQQAQRALSAATNVDAKAQQDLAKKIELVKNRLSESTAKYVTAGGTFRKQTKDSTSRFSEFRSVVQSSGGPLAQAVSGVMRIGETLGHTRSMLILAAAGFTALAAGIGLVLGRMASFAIESANTRRAELLRLEGLTRLRTALTMTYGIKAGKASDIQSSIDRVSASVSIARDQVAAYAEQLYGLGARGAKLDQALEAVSITASAQGQAAASAALGWAAYSATVGGGVDKFADRTRNRLGGIVQKQMRDLNVIALKTRENMNSLFAGIDDEPFLQAKKAFADVFAQSTESGRYLRDLFTRVFQPFVNGAALAQNAMKRAFQYMILGELEVEIAFYKLRRVLKQWASEHQDAMRTIEVLAVAVGGTLAYQGMRAAAVWGVSMVKALVGVARQFTAVGLRAAIAWGQILLPFAVFAAAFYGTIKLLESWFDTDDWGQIGIKIIDGIAAGFAKAKQLLFDAVSGIANGLKTVFKVALGIKSPSKAFAELGEQVSLGVAVGVKAKAPDAREAVAAMVPVPAKAQSSTPAAAPNAAAPAAMPSVQPMAATRGNVTITIGDINVTGGGAGGAGIAQDIRRELESVLASVAAQMGAA